MKGQGVTVDGWDTSFTICVAFAVQHSDAGLRGAGHALSLHESHSHVPVPTRSHTLSSPPSPDPRLKSNFHQEITPGSMCCCLASTDDGHIEAKPMQSPGRSGFTRLVGREPWSSVWHLELFCKAQLMEQSSTNGANLNTRQHKKERWFYFVQTRIHSCLLRSLIDFTRSFFCSQKLKDVSTRGLSKIICSDKAWGKPVI